MTSINQIKRRHKVTKFVTKTGQLFAIVAVVAALLFVCSLVAEAQQKGAPEKKGAPAAAPEAKKAEPKAPAPSTPAESGEEFAACSPDYSSDEIAEMAVFLAEFSPDLAAKFKPIVLKCDFKVNDNLLGAIAEVQEEMADMEFVNAQQEKEYRQEKTKEIEIQIALAQQPVNQADLKKLVGELFDLRQRSMKAELVDLEKQVEALKKRIEEREKLKDKIAERRAKELAVGETHETEVKEPVDPLAWD
jgi:hypothetical protein